MSVRIISSGGGDTHVLSGEGTTSTVSNEKISVSAALSLREAIEDIIGESVTGDNKTIEASYDDESGKINLSTLFSADALEESATKITDSDNDTYVTVEKNSDDDRVRVYVDGEESVVIKPDGSVSVEGNKIENSQISGGTF